MKIYPVSEVTALIKQWAHDRNLIQGSTPMRQYWKLREEFGELCAGYAKGKPEMIKDAIGDCAVVLIIIAEQLDSVCAFKVHQFVPFDFKNVDYALICFDRQVADLGARILYTQEYDGVNYISSILAEMTQKFGLTIEECLSYAYDQIKDRKGKMIDGIFVKEEDL